MIMDLTMTHVAVIPITFEYLNSLPYSSGKALLLSPDVDLTELLTPGSDDLQQFALSRYGRDIEILKHVTHHRLPIAFHLCPTHWSSTSITQDPDVLAIKNEADGNLMFDVGSGEAVAHYLARNDPRWAYTEAAQNEKVLTLTTPCGKTVFEELVEHRYSWASTEAAQDRRYMKIIDKNGEYIVFQLVKKWSVEPATQDAYILAIRERLGEPEQRLAVVSYLSSNHEGYGWHLWKETPAALDPNIVSIKYKAGRNSLPVAMYMTNNKEWVRRITANDTTLLKIIDENTGSLLAHHLVKTRAWAVEALKLDESILTMENKIGLSVLDVGCDVYIGQEKHREYFKARLNHKYKDGKSFIEYAAIEGVNFFSNKIIIPATCLNEPISSNKEVNLNVAQHYVLFTPENNAAKIIFLMATSGMHIGEFVINDYLKLSEYETIVFNSELQEQFSVELDMLLKVLPTYCEKLLDTAALVRFMACIYASVTEIMSLVGQDVATRYNDQSKRLVDLFVPAVERSFSESIDTKRLLADLTRANQLVNDVNAKLYAREAFSTITPVVNDSELGVENSPDFY